MNMLPTVIVVLCVKKSDIPAQLHTSCTPSVTDLLVECACLYLHTDFFHSNSQGTGEGKSHPLQAPSISVMTADDQSNEKPSYSL